MNALQFGYWIEIRHKKPVCKNLHADAVSVVARTVADCDPSFSIRVETTGLFSRCANSAVSRYLSSVAVAVIGRIYLGRRGQGAKCRAEPGRPIFLLAFGNALRDPQRYDRAIFLLRAGKTPTPQALKD